VVAAEAGVRSRSSRASSSRVEGLTGSCREGELKVKGFLGWIGGSDSEGFSQVLVLVGQLSGRWTDDFMQINNNY
jgi:hypothetical protein